MPEQPPTGTEVPEGYRKEKLTIDLVQANRIGLMVLLPTLILYAVPFFLVHPGKFSLAYFRDGMAASSTWQHFLLFIAVFILGIVTHELVHGITWSLFAKKGFRAIRFGVLWKMLTPYCHCKEPLRVQHYRLGAVMPAIVIGFLPGVAAIVTGSIWWLAFAIFFTAAAIGDFMILYLLRHEAPDTWVQDHPSEAGCYVFRKGESED